MAANIHLEEIHLTNRAAIRWKAGWKVRWKATPVHYATAGFQIESSNAPSAEAARKSRTRLELCQSDGPSPFI